MISSCQRRRALITGVTGQSGSYLVELLLQKGYEIHGLQHRAYELASLHPEIAGLLPRIILHRASVEDAEALNKIVAAVQPDECYHLAASSSVSYDPERERLTLATNITGTLNLLSAIRAAAPNCKVCLACSSEIFGNPATSPQQETSPRHP